MSTTDSRGYGVGEYGEGAYGGKDEDNEDNETMTCQGTKSNGEDCSLPAGWGTDNEDYCKYHEDQDTDAPDRYGLELVGNVNGSTIATALGADNHTISDGTIELSYDSDDTGGDGSDGGTNGDDNGDGVADPDGPFVASSDGLWSDPATWEQNHVPTDGHDVTIPEARTVTIDTETARVPYLSVYGTLRHATDQDSHLRVETIKTHLGGRYHIGTDTVPIPADVTARVTFIDEGPIDKVQWPDRKGKGLLVHGDVAMCGATKTPYTTLATYPIAVDNTLELTDEPTNWTPGDDIVIPGVDPWHGHDGPMVLHDDERTIESIDGTTVTLDEPLDHDHVPPGSDLDAYALNLSRNVVLDSENDSEHRRGHIMVMSDGSTFRYVRLNELGRTDKNQYITDPARGHDTLPDGLDPNPAARYPLHWHHTGIDADEPHIVEGAVVDGSPGWGIVNHHAYVDVTDSITYDVLGAGFVAEGGNERGSFKRCFALRSEGSGDTIDSRSAGVHGGDPAIDDFGHAGHGFWLQSPLVECIDNVAAGHRHQAFVWWLRPLLDGVLAEGTTIDDSRVTLWPNLPREYVEGADKLLEAIDQDRFATGRRNDVMRETGKIPSTFAPIKAIRGNEAFASAGGADFSRHNFKWKHERFGDFSAIEEMTVYNIAPFMDSDGEMHSPDLPRHKAAGHQGRGGNVGVSFRYTSNVTLSDSRIIGSGRADSVGVPFHDYRWTTIVDNCTIENWDWGVGTGEHLLTWIRDCAFGDNVYDVHWSFDNTGPAILEGNDLDRVRHTFERISEKGSEVLGFSQEYGVMIDDRTSFVDSSRSEFVPFPDTASLSSVNNIEDIDSVDDETNLVGLTNAEMNEQYGICIGGALMPDDAEAVGYVDDGHLAPVSRDPPTCVWMDAVDGDSGDGFTLTDEYEAASGMCLSSTGSADPPADGEAASYSFDCAAGTYRLYARLWTESWNGDTLYVRFDGGEWVEAPKLKDPASFRWYSASERNGPKHEFDLDGGSHTLEIAAPNDGVLVDRLAIVSDGTVIGGHGV